MKHFLTTIAKARSLNSYNIEGTTETELKERRYRIEDALNSTRAAVDEGYVAGGGTALVNVESAVREAKGDTPDEQTGINIVYELP